MKKKTGGTKSRLIQAAEKTIYQQGFENTTLADIAQEAGVPLGNVYYHFKTKAAIGDAVIEKRLEDNRSLLSKLENESDPKKRLELFIQLTVDQRDSVARWGCPIGSFCTELHKQGGALADNSTKLFAANLKWIETQFTDLGKKDNAKNLALHLLAGMQGAGLLAHSFGDPEIIVREASQLTEWIRIL